MSHRRFPSNSRVQLSADSPGFGAGRVDRSVAECPEGVQQAGLCFGGQVVRADVAECGDGFPDLLYVPFAVGHTSRWASYMAVDLALVADVLPDTDDTA